jgi:hypothetical protein
MKKIIYLLVAFMFITGCTSIKTPEIIGVVVDAETHKPIADARIYAKWQKTVSGPGGQTGGAIAKELRIQTKADGSFAIPAYTLRNYKPYPFGQGGSFYIFIYVHGYMYKSFTFYETKSFERPGYQELEYIGNSIKSRIDLQIIKNEIEFDRNMTRIKDINDFHFAIDEYRQFSEMFPNSKKIPAIHLHIAHIYWSELNDFKSALSEYELFTKNYPDYELDDVTKMEIEWVKKG